MNWMVWFAVVLAGWGVASFGLGTYVERKRGR